MDHFISTQIECSSETRLLSEQGHPAPPGQLGPRPSRGQHRHRLSSTGALPNSLTHKQNIMLPSPTCLRLGKPEGRLPPAPQISPRSAGTCSVTGSLLQPPPLGGAWAPGQGCGGSVPSFAGGQGQRSGCRVVGKSRVVRKPKTALESWI